MKELFLVFARQYFSFPAMAVVRGSLESWNWLAAIYTLRKTIINVLWIYAPGFGAAVWCQNDPQPPLGELFSIVMIFAGALSSLGFSSTVDERHAWMQPVLNDKLPQINFHLISIILRFFSHYIRLWEIFFLGGCNNITFFQFDMYCVLPTNEILIIYDFTAN